jgi:acetylornithine deacetylase/succinyl-diaminopimelate desuccinylase-like protein
MSGGVELRRTEVFEPTCTICGLTSGYQGEGAMTVLPAEASAKVDFRLVPDQTPQEVLEKLRKHLDAHGFQDIAIHDLGSDYPARTDPDHPFIRLCNGAAREVYGKEPVIHPLIGGSGPIHPFVHVLGLPVTMCGVGYPGAQVHAPNEHIVMEHLIRGIKHTAHIIAGFGQSL